MTDVANLRAKNPWRLDLLVSYSGAAYRRSAPVAKHVASAHGVHESRARRYRIGDVSSPLAKALVHLASSPHTSAWPACVEALALVTQLQIEDATDDVLAARRAELVEMEHDLERDENRATCARDDAACLAAHTAKAEVHLELMCILRVQMERKARKQ